jgi:hypothetical protein
VLQQTTAAILLPRDMKALSAAVAAELCRSAIVKRRVLMVSKCIAALACFAIVSGAGIAQEKGKPPDEQVKDLIVKYRALSEKDQTGPEGANIIKQLKAVSGKLSPQSKDAVGRMECAHNLRLLALALHPYNDTKLPDMKRPVDPNVFSQLLPYFEQGFLCPTDAPRRWQYKVVAETDILKLGKDDLATGLNKLGEDGWELVGFEKTRFILKRATAVPK